MIDAKVVKEVRPEVPERPALWAAVIREEGEAAEFDPWGIMLARSENIANAYARDWPTGGTLIRIPGEAEAKWAEERERLVGELIQTAKTFPQPLGNNPMSALDRAILAIEMHDRARPGAEE